MTDPTSPSFLHRRSIGGATFAFWLCVALAGGALAGESRQADALLCEPVDGALQYLAAHPETSTPELVRALNARAVASLRSLDYDDAGRAAVLAAAAAIRAGDSAGLAVADSVDAMLAVVREDIAAAARSARSAVALAARTDDRDASARAWLAMAEVVRVRAGAAMIPDHTVTECLTKALSAAEHARDRSAEVSVLLGLNYDARLKLDLRTARQLLDRAAAIAQEIGDDEGECEVAINLALLYYTQIDHARGLFYARRAVAIAEKHRSKRYARAMVTLGFGLANVNDVDGARRAIEAVVPRDERGGYIATAVFPRTWLGLALIALANVADHGDRPDEAVCLLRQNDAIYNDAIYAVSSVYEVSHWYLEHQDYSTALRLSMESVAHPQTRRSALAKALMHAARAYRGLHQPERALAVIREGIDIREELDTHLAGDREQRVRATATANFYKFAASFASDAGKMFDALLFLEQGRAGVLNGILGEDVHDAFATAAAADREERLRRERDLARLRVAFDAASRSGKRKSAAAAAQRLRDAREEYASFVDGVESRSARRGAVRRHIDAKELTARLRQLPRGMVAIEYLVDDDDGLHIYSVTPRADGTVRISDHPTKLRRRPLEEKVDDAVARLAGRDVGFADVARSLYEVLIRPVEREIANATAILIVPDESLCQLPFAALMDSRKRYLIERAAIVYAPSIVAYTNMAERRRDDRVRPPIDFLGIADPAVDRAGGAPSVVESADYARLPEAGREIDEARAFYRRAVVLKGDGATEARAKREMGRADVIHFAGHAVVDEASPMYARLLLSRHRDDADDGALEIWEVTQLRLHADLVVLSACDTAKGKFSIGEGVVGMVWSLFVAGARSIVATQWRVPSAATADLMIAFHRRFRSGNCDRRLCKAEALRAAQLAVLHTNRHAHPLYWAAFALYGDAGTRAIPSAPPDVRLRADARAVRQPRMSSN